MWRLIFVACVWMLLGPSIGAQPLKPTTTPLVRTVDLNLGESQVVTLHDGSKATVKLLYVDEIRDSFRSAVRTAQVHVEVNGQQFPARQKTRKNGGVLQGAFVKFRGQPTFVVGS